METVREHEAVVCWLSRTRGVPASSKPSRAHRDAHRSRGPADFSQIRIDTEQPLEKQVEQVIAVLATKHWHNEILPHKATRQESSRHAAAHN